ncbi:hypothetical protein [Spirilliplanes yamanashiensis]|uniref:Uncharacterized protein n=1 Tax=Spirilliplanes yamanashiensis TaxID=42233 RepID=A0A8J3Y7F1_9ACTN|nr:hypothetical protein [Spirilliplanes yamanashiensis]MDP9815039.1 hypothetical protein [Spirilliplanes yamanashiensis]GIJ02695.1 hypothetical protein Sya03_20470 [Spirilliplanes yamanashiensis]
MTVFACRACGAALTRGLSRVPLAALGEPLAPFEVPPGEDCPPWIMPGAYAVDPEPDDPPVSPAPRLGTVLINAADLLDRRLHPDPRRLVGCCGLDGCDGPNLVCACGAEIATERSDCWTPQVVLLEPDAVS